MERKDWAGVLMIFDKGLSPFPNSQHLAQNRKDCQDKLKAEGSARSVQSICVLVLCQP
jgi:hypothetical protein